MKIAVQLYNFRNELARDYRGTLRKIAEMGFDGVEFAGDYGKIPPEELADFLRETGLECAGTMFGTEALKNRADQAYTYASQLKTPAVTINWRADFVEIFQEAVDTFSLIGSNAASHGLRFSYHNHWWEFEKMGESTAMEKILAATDPEKVFIEPDVCWLHRAGIEPVQYLEKYRDRIAQVHLKDILKADDQSTTTELGKGIIGIGRIIRKVLELPECSWMIYEQDNTPEPFESAAESLRFIQNNI